MAKPFSELTKDFTPERRARVQSIKKQLLDQGAIAPLDPEAPDGPVVAVDYVVNEE